MIRLNKLTRSIWCFVLCLAMAIPTVDLQVRAATDVVEETDDPIIEETSTRENNEISSVDTDVIEETPPTNEISTQEVTNSFDSGLLVNGAFANDIADLESVYGDGTEDGQAEAWQYWTNAVLPRTILENNGVRIEALSITNGVAERVTIQQTVTNLKAGSTYRLTGAYNVSSTSIGRFSIDINGHATIASHTSATDGWQTFSQDVTLGENITSLQVRIMVSSGAELVASVKEFKLIEVTSPTLTYESNGLVQNYKYVTNDVTSIEYWSYYPSNVVTDNHASVAVQDGTLSVTLNNTSNFNINQTIGIDEVSEYDKYYIVTGKIKASDLTSNAYLRVQLLNSNNTTAHNNYMWTSVKYTGTTEWQDVVVVVPVPNSIGTVAISGFKIEQIVDKGTGSASFKDLNVYATAIAYDASNLIINPAYVNNGNLSAITPWTYYPAGAVSGGNVTVSVNEEQEFSVTLNGSSNINLYQTVKLDTANSTLFNKYYKITGEIKTEELSNNAYLRAQLVNANNSQISSSYLWTSEKYKGTNGWTSVSMYIPVPAVVGNESVVGFKVEQIADRGTGTVKFRNLRAQITALEFDEDNILKNPAYFCENVSNISAWAYSPANKLGITYNAVVDSTDHYFKLTGLNTTESMTLYQKVEISSNVVADTIYRLTGKMKAVDLSGNACVRIRLDDAEGQSLAVVKTSRTITGTTLNSSGEVDWVDVEFEFEVPGYYYASSDSSAAPIAVGDFKVEQIVYKGNATSVTGSAFFKDLKVEPVSTIDRNLSPIVGEANNSLIVNGGFERTYNEMPRWWSVWESTGGLDVDVIKTNTHSGNYALRLKNKSEGKNSRGSVHQTFNVEANSALQGHAVKVTQWVKAPNYSGAGLSLRLQYTTYSGAAVGLTTKYINAKAAQDWTEVNFIIDVPSSELKTIKIEYLYDEGQGEVLIDDVSVTEYVKAKNIAVNTEYVDLAINGTAQVIGTPIATVVNGINVVPTIGAVTYLNPNTEIISVGEDGTVTALAEGTATITIQHIDGVEKEVGVLVANEKLNYTETINTIVTVPGETKTGSLPEGYIYTVVAKPQNGTFVLNGSNYSYYPDNGFEGTDTVTLLVTGNGKSALVVVGLLVSEVDAVPIFEDFLILTNKNETVTGGMVASDAETSLSSLSYAITTAPEHGTLNLSGENSSVYTYSPENNYAGYDSAVVTVTDDYGNETSAKVTIYIAETVSEILASVNDTGHSFLLANDNKFSYLKANVTTDENLQEWLAYVVQSVEPIMNAEPVPWNLPDGVRLDTQGAKDVANLAFLYRVTGEERYYQRAKTELYSLCVTYEDWHPAHLLDTAMMANGVALAYDWLYTTLADNDPTLLAQVELGLYEKCIIVAKEQYEEPHMFVTNGFNWNYVCNGGFATAAFALAHHEEYGQEAGEILQLAYKSIQYGLPQYAPEGDSIEGVSYWDYGTRYLVSFLAVVSSAIGENPFLGTAGLDLTALYPIYMSGKAGSFNYSDNDTTAAVGYLNSWFAEAYNQPALAWYHKFYMEQGNAASIYDMIYYNPSNYNTEADLDLDRYYTAQAVTTMRRDYNNQNSAFVGFKGGITGAPHGDLDIGTFIYDLYGVRWATEAGKENYNMLGYWDLTASSPRWSYYRKDAAGHNTLMINPTESANQYVGSYSGALETSLNGETGGYTILDMTPAYQHEAASVRRGIAFIDRTQVLVRDEYTLKSVGDIYWQMHTEANVDISADGNTATLSKDGKQIEVRILGESTGLEFETMAAVYYGENESAAEGIQPSGATGAASDQHYDRTSLTKLYIKAEGVQVGSFSVLLTPSEGLNPEVKELVEWQEYDFNTVTAE